ncbi:MAG: ABC transporter permease [Oscillospiraceae bacterium]|jgi:oligopeptide transport system permease protein|nr:ABC transporter permease [Oscillospiraceae bacterium]
MAEAAYGVPVHTALLSADPTDSHTYDYTPLPNTAIRSGRAARPPVSYWRDALDRLLRNKTAVASFAFIILTALFGFAGSSLMPGFTKQDLYNTFLPPLSPGHPLGTDELGRDLLARLARGTRISLTIGVTVSVINLVVGLAYGGLSGYIGGMADVVMMRIVEIVTAVPEMIILLLLLTVLKSGMGTLILALCLTGWTGMARLARAQALQLRENEYVLAARVLGASRLWIVLRHMIPNALGPIMVRFAMSVPGVIFAESFLSYIGLGIAIPEASWGNLAQLGANQFPNHIWLFFIPAILFSLTMLAFNLLGDGLRDALDPRQRR